MSTDAYIQMVYKNLKGELNPDEFDVLNRMTGEDPKLAELRIEIEDAWDVSGVEQELVSKEDTERLIQKITQKKETSKITKRTRIRRLTIPGIAALFILAFCAVWLMRDQTEVYDEEGLFRLSDNSMVELREGSRLEVVAFTEEVRNVILEGEAYFDIEEDPERPFIISTSNAKIEVLGTEFLVKDFNNTVYVAVKEGSVRFSNNAADESMVLTAGMKAKSGIDGEIRKVQYQNLMGWKDGVIQYSDQEFAKVIEELCLVFNVSIVVENKQLLNCRISAILTAENLSETLNQLAGQLGMDAKKDGQNWKLSGGKCK